MSAYPVAFPGQFVLVDVDRSSRPDMLTPESLDDLDDNIVVVEGDDASGRWCLIKRLCAAPGAPGGWHLASVDSGRRSPWVDPARVDCISPVVAVVFVDPRKPRQKMRHAITAIPEL